ncbi:MAG: hypothetical protein ACOCXH_10070, partial [Cyclobacteriaceae bacterium]
MRTISYLYFTITLSISSCEQIAMDRDFPLYLQNNSVDSVVAFLNLNRSFGAIYPDTTISPLVSSAQSGIVEIKGNTKEAIAGGSGTWEEYYEVSVPSDTLSVFMFHPDTLAKYEWHQIIEDYNILKRYDLSLGDLKRLDFIITYPPGR